MFAFLATQATGFRIRFRLLFWLSCFE